MDITIRLKKEWDNAGTKYPEGQLLKVSEENAQSLIKDGIAELYVKKSRTDYSFLPGGPVGDSAVDGFEPISARKFWLDDDDATGGPDGGGFSNFAEFLRSVKAARSGKFDQRLTVEKDLSESDGGGGFTVPQYMSNWLWLQMLEQSPFFSQATYIPMSSNRQTVPFIYDTDRSASGLHGIDVPTGLAEGEALTDISPTFKEAALTLNKIGGRCRVSNEMLEDSPLVISTLLPTVFSDALSWEMIRQFVNGTGAGQALGVLNSPACVEVAKEDGQSADTICYENICELWSRMLPAARRTAVWQANVDCEPQLRQMSLSVGTGGSAVFVVNASVNQPASIFGRPLVFSEHNPTLGDAGDICCFNPRAYAIGKKSGGQIRIESSPNVRFENDQTVFRAIARLDGQPLQSLPITSSNSSKTLSHFVKLGERT